MSMQWIKSLIGSLNSIATCGACLIKVQQNVYMYIRASVLILSTISILRCPKAVDSDDPGLTRVQWHILIDPLRPNNVKLGR